MSAHSKLTAKDVDWAIQMYERGQSLIMISRELSISVTGLWKRLRQRNVRMRSYYEAEKLRQSRGRRS